MASGDAGELKKFVEQFMAEYDSDGWIAADLISAAHMSRVPNGTKR